MRVNDCVFLARRRAGFDTTRACLLEAFMERLPTFLTEPRESSNRAHLHPACMDASQRVPNSANGV